MLGNEQACRSSRTRLRTATTLTTIARSTVPEQAYGTAGSANYGNTGGSTNYGTAGSASYGTAGSVSAGAPSVGPTSGGPIVTCQGGFERRSSQPGITGVI